MSMLVNSTRFGSASFTYPISLPVVNAGAEAGDASGWTAAAGGALFTSSNDYASGFPSSADTGSRYFYAGASSSSSRMYQDVDVSAYAADIDAGILKALLSIRVATFDAMNDYCGVYIRALNVSGTVLQSVSLAEYLSQSVTSWETVQVGMIVPTATRKIRIEVWGTRIQGVSNDVHFDSVALSLQAFSYTLPPRYDTSISYGNRTGSITVTATNIATGGGTISGLVDGSLIDNYWWTSATGDGSGYIKFQLPSPWIIDEFIWRQDTTNTHGTWRLEGSNDDATWTQVGVDFTLRPGVNSPGNPSRTAYSYYRLRHMSNSRSSAPYLKEIIFRADSP